MLWPRPEFKTIEDQRKKVECEQRNVSLLSAQINRFIVMWKKAEDEKKNPTLQSESYICSSSSLMSLLESLWTTCAVGWIIFHSLKIGFYAISHPRSQADHGTMVLHCQPWSTMVDNDVTMVAEHGASSGTWPWDIANHGQIGISPNTHTSSSSLLECCPVKCMLCFQETIFDVQMSGNEYNEIWGITWNNMIYHGLRNWAKITGTLTLLVWGMLWILAL